MRRRAETVDTETPGIACFDERPEADKPCTKQWRGLRIRIHQWYGDGKSLVGSREVGVAAITCIAGELRVVAQVLHPGLAVCTNAAGAAKPRDDRKLRIRQLAINNVKIGAADGARLNSNQDFADGWRWIRELGLL